MITVSNNKYETKSRSEDTIMKVRGGGKTGSIFTELKKDFLKVTFIYENYENTLSKSWKSEPFCTIYHFLFLKMHSV